MSDDILATVVKGQYSAVSDDVRIGENAVIWNLVYIGRQVTIGAGVIVGSLVHIGDDVAIGADTQIEGSSYIATHSKIGRGCFIGPGVVITNDPFPPARRLTGVPAWSGVTIEDGAIIGGGAKLKAGIVIGRRAVVGMGSVVLSDVPSESVVVGVPARVIYTRADYDRKQREWASQCSGDVTGAVTTLPFDVRSKV